MKKLAVIASAWHFPAHFYEAMARQVKLEGWQYDLFCVAHRDPLYAKAEKHGHKYPRGLRGKLDKILYKEIASKNLIEAIGWNYKEYPNTIGDWGNTNQWLADHNYKDYDLILATHDDNLIIHDRMFADIIEDGAYKEWDILTNSPGMPQGSIRGSFEFFKPRVIELMGGRFNDESITLTREGNFSASQDITELYDWNNWTPMIGKFVEDNNLKVGYLSPSYRISAYCLEGERGYISNTHGENTFYENQGLNFLHENGVI